jgi:hypothetical protein
VLLPAATTAGSNQAHNGPPPQRTCVMSTTWDRSSTASSAARLLPSRIVNARGPGSKHTAAPAWLAVASAEHTSSSGSSSNTKPLVNTDAVDCSACGPPQQQQYARVRGTLCELLRGQVEPAGNGARLLDHAPASRVPAAATRPAAAAKARNRRRTRTSACGRCSSTVGSVKDPAHATNWEGAGGGGGGVSADTFAAPRPHSLALWVHQHEAQQRVVQAAALRRC